MSYFNEVAEYQSYSHGEADFHFIYNSNSGGGQSFLGGQFINESGKLSSPTILDGRIGVFYIATGEVNNQKRRILLNDAKGRYEIKPRGEGSTSMKLGVGTTMVSPNKLISAFFMLPPTCTIKTPKNLDVSILTSNNYWLQSMWLECGKRSDISNEVYLMPIDYIYCGGSSKEGSGIGRYFKLDAERRIADIISLCENTSRIPESIRQYVKLFAEIYTENALFEYDRCSEAISRIMVTLSKDYPDKYTGIEDPLPFLMRIAFPNAPKHIHKSASNNESSLQKIFYGAPGTGKSHVVKEQTGEWLNEDEDQDLPNVFRTTFHPDTDYASFVGCYKPTMKPTTNAAKTLSGKEEEIVYEYVPQVFADAYIYAYNNPTEPTYLVIEEINRGNCAQIFGDLFQLLDRKNGKSEYKIKADKDLAKYLCEATDKDGHDILKDKEGIKDGKLCLPVNLHILATMNTSDQSLFPMDSAFKRRWEWEYVPINYSEKIKSGSFEIKIGGKTYSWVKFIEEVNKHIFDLTQSEDKQMGNFFIKHSVDEKEFKSKVMFYLWYEVLRDETGHNMYFFCKKESSESKDAAQFTFKDLYESNATETLQQFMTYLGVSPK